jgi:hypothetical protein
MFIGLLLVAVNPLVLVGARGTAAETLVLAPAGAQAAASDRERAITPDALVHPDRRSPVLPANFLILRHVAKYGVADPDTLVEVLAAAGHRLSRRTIADSLAAAEKSGVVEVGGIGADPAGQLSIQYRPTEHGRAMIERFIG